jgi:hypothetical protein
MIPFQLSLEVILYSDFQENSFYLEKKKEKKEEEQIIPYHQYMRPGLNFFFILFSLDWPIFYKEVMKNTGPL